MNHYDVSLSLQSVFIQSAWGSVPRHVGALATGQHVLANERGVVFATTNICEETQAFTWHGEEAKPNKAPVQRLTPWHRVTGKGCVLQPQGDPNEKSRGLSPDPWEVSFLHIK